MSPTLTFDGFPGGGATAYGEPVDPLRRPSIQDAALAALLLAGSIPGAGDERRWVPIGVCVAAVAVRRRWPLPALAAAVVATVAHMAMAAAPVAADLAVPILLGTIAVYRRPAVSLALLGVVLATATAWSVHVSLDGERDGWVYSGPWGVGGEEQPPAGPGRGGQGAPTGPTSWGGLPVLGSLLSVAWAVGWGERSRRAYLAELAATQARERDRQAAEAVAAERARITRELHDVVAHGLAVIVMQAQGGAAAFAKRPADTLTALDTIVTTGRASLAEMRQVLSTSSAAGDPGLAQLSALVDQVRQAGTPVEWHVTGSPRPLPTGVDVSAYRIVQEALTNTMKHAGPGARATVLVSYGDALTLEVGDDGSGAAPPGTGNGLRGMRERAELLGGSVTAGPCPDGGYLVLARLPLGVQK
ncbi:signal transduction histidine kinase [Actinoplanes tereljensis]|nr:sensor histidine kinase [Actinoplanes tereljensis]